MNATPDEYRVLQRFLTTHGVARFLPTTVTAPVDFTRRALESIANAIEAPGREGEARPVGIHIEGPFLSHSTRGMRPADALRPSSYLTECNRRRVDTSGSLPLLRSQTQALSRVTTASLCPTR